MFRPVEVLILLVALATGARPFVGVSKIANRRRTVSGTWRSTAWKRTTWWFIVCQVLAVSLASWALRER